MNTTRTYGSTFADNVNRLVLAIIAGLGALIFIGGKLGLLVLACSIAVWAAAWRWIPTTSWSMDGDLLSRRSGLTRSTISMRHIRAVDGAWNPFAPVQTVSLVDESGTEIELDVTPWTVPLRAEILLRVDGDPGVVVSPAGRRLLQASGE